MTKPKQKIVKQAIFIACQEHIDKRIATAEEALVAARDASHDDTKSSAGDKYETGREMMQQEISRNERLLAEAKAMQQLLGTISMEETKESGSLGAVIETNQGVFFLGPGIGLLPVGQERVFAISVSSPIGQLLIGCNSGDTVSYGGRDYLIQKIY